MEGGGGRGSVVAPRSGTLIYREIYLSWKGCRNLHLKSVSRSGTYLTSNISLCVIFCNCVLIRRAKNSYHVYVYLAGQQYIACDVTGDFGRSAHLPSEFRVEFHYDAPSVVVLAPIYALPSSDDIIILPLFKEVNRQNARPSKVLTTERLVFSLQWTVK